MVSGTSMRSYGRNKAKQMMHGNINADNLRIALGPVGACAAVAGCVPFNLFGGRRLDHAGDARLCWLRTERQRANNRRWISPRTYPAACSSFRAARLGVAAGVEYRKLQGPVRSRSGRVAAGFSSDIPAQPTKGSYDVKEAYAEINAPLLSDQPFADLLEFTGAVRFSDYSTSGSTTTFKAGANWKPIPDLRLRVTWAEGFRAPSIGELFGTLSRFDQRLTIHVHPTAHSTVASPAAMQRLLPIARCKAVLGLLRVPTISFPSSLAAMRI